MIALGAMVAAPLAGALVLAAVRPSRPGALAGVTVMSSMVSVAAGGFLLAEVWAGRVVEVLLPGPALPGGMGLRADGLSLGLAALSAVIWLAAGLQAVDYLRGDERRRVYHISYLLTLTGVLGTFLAADFLSLLLFFEVMTLASYLLVVHTRSPEALSAGGIYLYLSLAGGLVVALGLALVQHVAGSLDLAVTMEPGVLPVVATVMMVVGFSVKAGLAPLHLWLPRAHPVAPAPASAVLSGIMIKTGAYGILRSLFAAGHGDAAAVLSLCLLVVAAVTMLAGVSMALLQSDAKRMLAYHSVSQMGYVCMGVALGVYLGPADPMGLAGGLYHMFNHALFKSALFMVAGAVYMRTGQLDMYRLGGLWRHMPVTALFGLVAACGIAGVPGLNGYVSKTLLHHGLEHAIDYRATLKAVEWAFVITGAGTACSFIKFFGFIFLGRPRSDYPLRPGPGVATHLALVLPSALILLLGLRPGLFLSRVAGPALVASGYAPLHLKDGVFTVPDLTAVGLCLGLGAVLFAAGTRFGWFHAHPPAQLSVGWLASRLAELAVSGWDRLEKGLEIAGDHVRAMAGGLMARVALVLLQADEPGASPMGYHGIRLSNLTFGTVLVVTLLLAVLVYSVAARGIPVP